MSDPRTEILELVGEFNTAMLSTVTPDGTIHARPMSVAGREDNHLWFATSMESAAADEIRTAGVASASFQGSLVFATVSGPAKIVNDPTKIEALWSESWAGWFPDGPSDPDLVLVCLEGEHAHSWDLRGMSGVKAAVKAFGSMVARQLEKTGDASQHVRF